VATKSVRGESVELTEDLSAKQNTCKNEHRACALHPLLSAFSSTGTLTVLHTTRECFASLVPYGPRLRGHLWCSSRSSCSMASPLPVYIVQGPACA
jgi:hypothetical protein